MRAYQIACSVIIVLCACNTKKVSRDQTEFTEIDSLTETYLTLEDSILNTWNAILRDENEKIKSMHELVHALLSTSADDKSALVALEQRLDQLEQLRFEQQDIDDPHTVEEYDFASNSLVSEVISEAEARPDFAANLPLQKLVDQIKISDQHIGIYRADYDSAATRFNEFLDKHKSQLENLDESLSKEKKPLF